VLIPAVPSTRPEAGVLPAEKEFTPRRGVVLHAAWLRQGCPHCARFLTAASRRSLARVSVPVWLIILSDQLWIAALVRRYRTNKLIQRRPIPERPKAFKQGRCRPRSTCGISPGFPGLFPTLGQVAYALRTRAPLGPKASYDLHVLSPPPAFVLSQDQTLRSKWKV
jgi:hypothetical protein